MIYSINWILFLLVGRWYQLIPSQGLLIDVKPFVDQDPK